MNKESVMIDEDLKKFKESFYNNLKSIKVFPMDKEANTLSASVEFDFIRADLYSFYTNGYLVLNDFLLNIAKDYLTSYIKRFGKTVSKFTCLGSYTKSDLETKYVKVWFK